MNYLRSRYVYSAFRNEFWDCRAKAWISSQGLDNFEAHRMPVDGSGRAKSAFGLLRRDKRADRVHLDRYIPGCHDEIATIDGVQWLNTWVAPDIEPIAGNAKPLIDHIHYLCNGDEAQANHISDWLAYAYQNPGRKLTHAILIISSHQGVGKDTLAEAMQRVMGAGNVPYVQDEALSEGRYHFMKGAQLAVVPEIMCGDRKDVANKLKPLITQPTCEINEKHVKPYTVQNTVNFLMFSNHENAAHIEDNDRRYFVVICRGKPRDEGYYAQLHSYIGGPDIAGFAHFLASRDLSNFNPKAPAPMTADKTIVQAATKGGAEAWLEDAWQSGAAPFDKDVLNIREALDLIGESKGAPRMTLQQVTTFLKKVGGDLDRKRIGKDGKQVRVWAVRDYEDVSKLSTNALAFAYQGVPWRRAVMKAATIEAKSGEIKSGARRAA
ncbi:hypothetical protein SAMN04488567_0978 [Limimaricola pyoseonensis]|uniref:NrS-1 polymerase-like helicase domain-containing protein n=2 Tax=Limimaricola pyoseonensis TaxID=521013 RepID=A0A1G7AL35_9RHOB|nr:hypothetical protein SAMN04488567_0978 [Limimaricola pyoseonensis]